MSTTKRSFSSNPFATPRKEYDTCDSACGSEVSTPVSSPLKRQGYVLPEPAIPAGMVIGENGAISHETSGDLGLDLSFKLLRDLDIEDLKTRMDQIIATDDKAKVRDLFLLAFQTRNCRAKQGGKGEKNLFHEMFLHLHKTFPDVCIDLLELVPEFGSWKDIKELVMKKEGFLQNTREFTEACMDLFVEQLKTDLVSLDKGGDKISLAAKWAPRENSEFYKKERQSFTYLLQEFVTAFQYSDYDVSKPERFYRQSIAKLNKELDTIEIKMCAGKWSEIDYAHAPSVAVTKFRKAHLNEKLDEDCDDDYVETGNRFPDNADRVAARKNIRSVAKKGKLNGGQLQPHEITSSLHGDPSAAEEEVLSAQWVDLRKKVAAKGARKLIPVCDVSGSMSGTPMDVCVALGLLLSEVIQGPFANRVITFHEDPSWVNLETCTTIREKVSKIYDAPWGGSTNLKATFDLILRVVTENHIPQEDIPDLVIFSDMQFNSIDNSGARTRETHLQYADRIFRDAGYKRPNIFFWNLRDTAGVPAPADENGTVLLSGYSHGLFKYLLFDEMPPDQLTPYGIYRAMLDDVVYDCVRDVLDASEEFATYFRIRESRKLSTSVVEAV
jgi:Mg-chelatase subunit ChlD